MKMPKAELGLKRGCLSCAMKFYDFNRTPIICPGCGAEFDPEALVRSRRGRAAAKPAAKAAKAAPEADSVETENDIDEAAEDEVVADAGNAESGDTDEDAFDDSDIDVSNDDSAGLIADDLDEEDEIIPGISTGDDD
ncbi:MAG: TIGR02300 family protein [Pseudomonadota bacterium]|nr:TIGR02300 family protein [Pseudomonadota bacterium]|tara:strand:- start:45 stop:455 length:411 start_codon:yes stop_codon:yes gene_type:complete